MCFCSKKHTGRRTTKGSPSGEQGRAGRAADRHVATATWRGRDVAGGRQGWWKKTEEEEVHAVISLPADEDDDV